MWVNAFRILSLVVDFNVFIVTVLRFAGESESSWAHSRTYFFSSLFKGPLVFFLGVFYNFVSFFSPVIVSLIRRGVTFYVRWDMTSVN